MMFRFLCLLSLSVVSVGAFCAPRHASRQNRSGVTPLALSSSHKNDSFWASAVTAASLLVAVGGGGTVAPVNAAMPVSFGSSTVVATKVEYMELNMPTYDDVKGSNVSSENAKSLIKKEEPKKDDGKPKTIRVSRAMAAKVAAEQGGQVVKKASTSSTPEYDF